MKTRPFKVAATAVPVEPLDAAVTHRESVRYDDLFQIVRAACPDATVSWCQKAAASYLRRNINSGALVPVEQGSTTYKAKT